MDYKSDEDFWYNLPANFELLDVCFRMYRLTGDMDYIQDEDFVRFYDWTIHQYAQWWDKDHDLLLERKYPALARREYPEVSFAAVGSFVCGAAGMEINAPGKEVTVFPAQTEDLEWSRIENCPLLDGEADIIFKEQKIQFTNRTKQALKINGKAVKPGETIITEI